MERLTKLKKKLLSFDLIDLKDEMKKGNEKGCNFNFQMKRLILKSLSC